MTENMEKFIEHNLRTRVVEGARLTPTGGHVITKGHIDSSDRCRYIFDDGSTKTLLDSDQQSAPDFMPIWVGI